MSTSLGAISLPCLLPCSGLLSRQTLIHSTWRYFAGAVLIWYTVSRLLQQILLHKPLPFYGFVFIFLSYSSYYSSSPSFLFCSLAGFHLQKLLHTDAFTHRRFYTQKLLQTDAFTHKSCYTRKLLHTEPFTHRSSYTQTLLHTEAFTHRSFYTRKLLHTKAFTHKSFYTQAL